jgi:hypothetical protein
MADPPATAGGTDLLQVDPRLLKQSDENLIAEREGPKMRIGFVLMTVALVALLAPVVAVAQDQPDVEVSNLQWQHDVNKNYRVRGNFSRSPAPSPDFMQEVSADFRNAGTRTVKFVTWEYVVYADSDTTKEFRTYKFRSKAPLRPGESMRLSKQGVGIQYGRRVEARIVRVDYADGSVWRRAKF